MKIKNLLIIILFIIGITTVITYHNTVFYLFIGATILIIQYYNHKNKFYFWLNKNIVLSKNNEIENFIIDYKEVITKLEKNHGYNNKYIYDLLLKSIKLDSLTQYEESLKILISLVINLNNNKQYKEINYLIEQFIGLNFSIKICIGLLMVTNKKKVYLNNYKLLLEYTLQIAKDKYTEEQLTNLENRFK